MNEKTLSEIVRVDLMDASYAGTHASITPTFVNFFFGNNGTGKSTIAKTIQSGTGIVYTAGKTYIDYLFLIYNQEFIDDNFRSYRNLGGVFTLNGKNADIQKRIDVLTSARNETNTALKSASALRTQKNDAHTRLQTELYKTIWERGEAIRIEFAKTQKGKGKSKPFAEEILRSEPCNTDMHELRILYESAFSDTARHYPRFAVIDDVYALDALAGYEILNTVIVNSADTDLARFLRSIHATQWMREGHDSYSEQANGKCPYCHRELPVDFEQLVTNSFDDVYRQHLASLSDFITRYKKAGNALICLLGNLPEDVYPSYDLTSYREKLNVLAASIQANLDIMSEKEKDPTRVVALSSIAPILRELNQIISEINKLIDTNNAVVDAGAAKREECTQRVFSLLAYSLNDLITAYKSNCNELREAIAGLDADIIRYKDDILRINNDLRELRSHTVETDTAKDSINLMLRDSGMQGFRLEPKSGVDNVYEVRRPDGTIADNLSEGEKNFIAFLYFYHLVFGSTSEVGETREKIVVIDDPVSSMDSSSLFIVCTLVRQMIEVCRNNADNRNRTIEGSFIKQIFMLTHNAYFHREITYSYVSKYEYVSFYLIRKIDAKSTIRLSDDVNPTIPTERINVNPVKNSYAALWDEYKEVVSAVPLINVVRRILEYYFLQLCGYEGTTLRRIILVDGKAAGRFKDDNGDDDVERYQLASAMLAYINAGNVGMNDGIDYVEESINVAECRSIFEMIFVAMGQKQHFDMMMGRADVDCEHMLDNE